MFLVLDADSLKVKFNHDVHCARNRYVADSDAVFFRAMKKAWLIYAMVMVETTISEAFNLTHEVVTFKKKIYRCTISAVD